MTPSFIMNSSSPSPFHVEPNNNGDHDQNHQFFVPNYQLASSSSSHSYQFYFNSTQDQTGYYPSVVYHPQQNQLEGDNYATNCGSYGQVANKVDDNGLKLSLGNKEIVGNGDEIKAQKKQVKWISSKMRLKIDHHHQNQKNSLSSSNMENNDYSSNSSSNNIPIRVCSDCNTTKTPLWRSGPKGPKSLCNACGIRQRKARRAMAAAAAAANDTPFTAETPTVKIKMNHNKEKTKNNNNNTPQTVPFKKRCKLAINNNNDNNNNNNGATTTSSSSSIILSEAQEPKKLGRGGFEDFLIKLSNKLAFHHVFPQDEKEAAILLMAISSGLVHAG